MKILMLGWELPPYNSGGLGVASYQLCKALSKQGADIEFVVPYTADHKINFMKIHAAHPQDAEVVLKSGIAYDSFKYIASTGEISDVGIFDQSLIYEKAVERIIKLADFDVIHAHDWLTCRAGLQAKEISGKPLIVHIHSIESDRAGREHSGNPMVREIESQALLIADRVIAVSNHTKKSIIREYGIPADKIDVLHNHFAFDALLPPDGSNTYTYLEEQKRHGYKIVTNIGRLTIQKGLTNLLQAFQLVVIKNPKTILLIVGSGEQYYELLMLAAQLGISRNVIFTEFQRGKAYRDAYSIADLFVLPSISEPFGLTPLEAIGYGTPVIVSKQSGISEVLHNVLKVDFWDTHEMANKIVSVVQNDSLRDELHANSLREYMKLSWDDTANKLIDMYKQHVLVVS